MESYPPLRPEAELLLRCARTQIAPHGAERIRALLRGRIDWPYLAAQARRHGLVPLLSQNLRALEPHAVPERWSDCFRRDSVASAARNLGLTTELLRLLDLFDQHGIAALPFKG